MTTSIDPNQLQFQWRDYVNDSSLKNTYEVAFSYNGSGYSFVPASVVATGVNNGTTTSIFSNFLDQDKLNTFMGQAQKVDLAGVSWYGDWLKDNVGASTSGYLLPGYDYNLGPNINFNNAETGTITGLGKTASGELQYGVSKPGYDYGYISGSDPYTAQHIKVEQGSSILGDVFGGLGDTVANFINSDTGKLAMLAASVYAGGGFDSATADAAATDAATAEAASTSQYALAAPEGSGLGLKATTAASLEEMGGAQGLLSNATTANLAEMGGAQGLIGASTAGALIGEAGTGTSALTAGVANEAAASGVLSQAGVDTGVTANTLAGDLGSSLAAFADTIAPAVDAGAASGASALSTGSALMDKILGTLAGSALAAGISNAGNSSADTSSVATAKPMANPYAAPTLDNSAAQLDSAASDVAQAMTRGRTSTILTGGRGENESLLKTSQILLGKR